MVENNDVQDKIVIRQTLKKDAETVFKMIPSLAKYHNEGAEFRATIRLLNLMDLENYKNRLVKLDLT